MKKMMQAVLAQSKPAVIIWLNVMTLVLVGGGAVFMFDHSTALLVFLSAIFSLLAALALFARFQNIYVLGATHIPLWGPLVVYILATDLSAGADLTQPYVLWLATATLVMTVSLLFDVRDLYLVLTRGHGKTTGAA